MKKHLRYEYCHAWDAGEKRHALEVIDELGITYQHSTPQSMAEQWWFWNCENIPDNLPSYITELNVNPFDVVGYGLSKEDAAAICDNSHDGPIRDGKD